jgi:glutathione S-transferase
MRYVLHHHPLSSYCQKVRIACYELGVDFEPRHVDLGNPQERAAFLALWPTGKIPLLVADGRVVPETSIMIEFLQQHHAGAQPLLPREAQARLEVRLWDRLCDQYVMAPMMAIVANELRPAAQRDPLAVEASLATLRMAYAMLERQLAGREWLAGSGFSMADCAAAPALFYAATLCPFPPECAGLAAYFERLVARASVRRAWAEAQPFFSNYPFYDRIPGRFLQPLV